MILEAPIPIMKFDFHLAVEFLPVEIQYICWSYLKCMACGNYIGKEVQPVRKKFTFSCPKKFVIL